MIRKAHLLVPSMPQHVPPPTRLRSCVPWPAPWLMVHAPSRCPCADAELDEDWAVELGRDAEAAYFDDEA